MILQTIVLAREETLMLIAELLKLVFDVLIDESLVIVLSSFDRDQIL